LNKTTQVYGLASRFGKTIPNYHDNAIATMTNVLKQALKVLYRSWIVTPIRASLQSAIYFNAYYRRRIVSIVSTSFRRPNELSNFTYDLTPRNQTELVHVIAVVTGRPVREIRAYVQEVRNDIDLHSALYDGLRRRGYDSDVIDNPFGRRIGWYAFVRALKPAVVVETGVDRGHGSLILCAALLRNAEERRPGYYYGTDINPDAGWLLCGKYAEVGKVLYGDSIESMKGLNEKVDLFINDSDHSADYEFREYETIGPRLGANAVILGDNSHTNDKLARYSEQNGRHYLFFKEEPLAHWYPGAGIGISFLRKS